MKKRVKMILLATAVLLAAAIAAAALGGSVKVEVYGVEQTTVVYKFKEKGIAVSGGEAKIFAPIGGRIAETYVKEGERVSAGDLIAKIDTEDIEAQLKQLDAKITGIEGQKTSSASALQQQIAQLQAELDAVIQQEKEAYKGPYSAQLEQQQNAVASAESLLHKARSEYDRINSLFADGVVAQKDLDDADFSVKNAEDELERQQKAFALITEQASPVEGTLEFFASRKKLLQNQIDIARHELSGGLGQGKYYNGLIDEARANAENLRDRLSKSAVAAPVGGTVREISVKQGEYAQQSTLIAVILPEETMSIDAYVLARDAIYFNVSDKISIIQERKEEDAVFAGYITAIAPAAVARVSALGLEEQRVKITVVPDAPVPDIKAGYEFDVEFYPLTRENTLAVPASALFTTDDGDAVWVIRNGTAATRTVEKGITAEEMTVIRAGLAEGDKVIRDCRQEGVKEGARVKAVNTRD
ncbi:MAG: biotin/lipoyl-binding protein [Clostridiales bacterium]|jgi:HlyD family secretion protein|nr:biotin/lipoyl-binding protein [Clostridiales bacterium]